MEKKIKKKLLLVVSMLAVMFALAGCSLSDKVVEFDYDPNELAELAQSQATQYMSIANVDEMYNYVSQNGAEDGLDESIIDAVEAFSTLEDNYGEFIKFKSDFEYEEVEDTVVVRLFAECADKEAVVKATFVDNTVAYEYQKYYMMNSSGYSDSEAQETLATNGVYPYKISEFELSANQTMADKMKDAGAHTVIGMGIVFIALIFISFIISLLKYVPALLDKETREAKKAEKSEKETIAQTTQSDDETVTKRMPEQPARVVDIVNTATGESAMGDGELVAVITAAIAASEGGRVRNRVNYPSNDKLVVRPRRRNKR